MIYESTRNRKIKAETFPCSPFPASLQGFLPIPSVIFSPSLGKTGSDNDKFG
jgi:hypothetical protein